MALKNPSSIRNWARGRPGPNDADAFFLWACCSSWLGWAALELQLPSTDVVDSVEGNGDSMMKQRRKRNGYKKE